MRKLLYLDVDGVILPVENKGSEDTLQVSSSHPAFPLSNLHALSRIVSHEDIAFNLEIILSSGWRLHETQVKALVETLQEYGAQHGGYFADFVSFHDVTKQSKHNVRKWEVAQHVEKAIETSPDLRWVALDDNTSFKVGKKYADLVEGHYVLCDRRKGLTNQNADEAITILTTT